MLPRVTIVTPTKNRRALLSETIGSVRAQTFHRWEHVIVDDGSDDGTDEMAEELARIDPRIRFLRREGERGGANVCRNIGIRAGRGDYVLFLDSDDLLEPGCLERRVAILDRNPDLDFITFQTAFFIREIGDQGYDRCPDLFGDDLTRFLSFETPWIISAPLWRRTTLERVGPFDETLLSWQDLELHVRALTMGVHYLRFPEIDHHVRWLNEVGRISADQRKSPAHLNGALAILEKFEHMVRDGPGMNWVRQRALCSLYFFVAERWAEAGNAGEALDVWRRIRVRSLGTRSLYGSGAVLLVAQARNIPCSRLTNKWKGWMRLRTNAELVPSGRAGATPRPTGRSPGDARPVRPAGSAAVRSD
ncbi:glycosyltransferase family 2 protein [Microbaculum marinum]|uniref:Glycosyltransferase family 2 protein n=1 Tax=Microbaculum marinum TaxID=1764581 RepID=A0AAW9RV97_9HYPH